jgi:glutamate synthase (NADPH/NADH) large chain
VEVAFVLDETGNFDYYCNMGMVELSLLEDRHDINELRSFISRHFEFTGSRKAKMILDDFDKYLGMFIKVIPYDYKKVLQEQKLEEIKKKIAGVELDVEFI